MNFEIHKNNGVGYERRDRGDKRPLTYGSISR